MPKQPVHPRGILLNLKRCALGYMVNVPHRIYRKFVARRPLHFYWAIGVGGWSALPHKEREFGTFELAQLFEQSPDPDNRVMLSDERDQLGCPRAKVERRLTERDVASVKRSHEILRDEFARCGLGRVEIDHDFVTPEFTSVDHGASHHMGTTRMHDDPRQGVVDANCRVHGIANLYIAGSSVFPTGGHANPTLTIVAMSMRLADHLMASLGLVLWLAVVCAAACAGPAANAAAQAVVGPSDRYAEVARQLEPWITSELASKGLPAVTIALVDDQQVVWARGFGFADRDKHVPATAEMVCRVGSVSKLFTALAVMQQVEQGKLDLDAPVKTVLPEFGPRNPFPVPITLRQLMAHCAGLVREPPLGHYFDPAPPPLLRVVESLSTTTLIYEPGTHTKYSNAGVAVVGAVLERAAREPFARLVERTVLKPLSMTRSSFEPSPALARELAHGVMWTYDGQTIATPQFLLGTGPAGNLLSTAVDLSRLVSCLFAEGRGPGGVIVKPETLQQMWQPQAGASGEPSRFGIGFALSKLESERRVGHGGAVYGFATALEALPDAKLGAVVIATADCANGASTRIAETALRMLLAVRQGKPLPKLETTTPLAAERARLLDGHYVHGDKSVDLTERGGKLYLSPFEGGMTVEVRTRGDALTVDDILVSGSRIAVDGNRITIAGETYEKRPAAKPAASPARFDGLIGEYGWDHDVLYVLEKDGRLHVLIEWFFNYPLTEHGPDRFKFGDDGLYRGEELVFSRGPGGGATQVALDGVIFRRRILDGEGGKTYRIKPRRPIEEIRREIHGANPPLERGKFRAPSSSSWSRSTVPSNLISAMRRPTTFWACRSTRQRGHSCSGRPPWRSCGFSDDWRKKAMASWCTTLTGRGK